jgi:drug/metabolite transporter (DMT)-like permease
MSDASDLPPRRIKNYWAAVIATAGLVIGIVLIVRGNPTGDAPEPSHAEPLRGILIIIISFAIAAVFYAVNNRHHIQEKAEHKEPQEFDQ